MKRALIIWTLSFFASVPFSFNAVAESRCEGLFVDPSPAEMPDQQFMKSYLGQVIVGPNCWNTALHAAGVISDLVRYFTPEEFFVYINSPFSSPVRQDQTQRGDIGAYRLYEDSISNSGAEVHGFVLLDNNMAYSKRNGEAPYEEIKILGSSAEIEERLEEDVPNSKAFSTKFLS